MENRKKRIISKAFDNRPELKAVFAYILGYTLLYLPSEFIDGSFPFGFWISEMNISVSVPVPLDDLFEIFFTGILFSAVLWYVFEKSVEKPKYSNEDGGDYSAGVFKRIKIMRYLLILFIAWMNVGNAIHVVSNHLNKKALAALENCGGAENFSLYYEIYFWDEMFGHLNLALPLYAILTLYLFNFIYSKPESKTSIYGRFFIFISAVGFGLEWVVGWADGQCLLVVALIEFVLFSILMYFGFLAKADNRINFKDHPFLLFILVQAITLIIGTILWGVVLGLKPHYPYFYQPDEKQFTLPFGIS